MAGKEKDVAVIIVTAELVAQMIADAIKNLVTVEQLQLGIGEATKGLMTEEQARELIAQSQNEMFDYVNAATLETITGDQPQATPLDPTWLEGLAFRGAKQEKKIVDGRPRLIGKSFTRPLLPDDVLSHRVDGDQVIIVSGDGQKHTVEI